MELAVLSGKGGTGKTTIATALAELAEDVIRVDCDVDAPNLYLFYKGKDIEKTDFIGGKKAIIDELLCVKCGKCETICRFHAVENFKINPFICEGCGACRLVCPQNAIKLEDEKTADTFITELDKGIISRAEMEVGSDGSGKLITYLRKNGRRFNKDEKLIIIDGSPGIGCSVISSITGSNTVLIVTEPTKSGLEDLMRVVSLCEHFGVFTMVCINKHDINKEVTKDIENFINEKGLKLVGKIPYDDIVMKSINELKPITYYKDSIAEKAIEEMWNKIKNTIKNC
ncbi:MinD superfamily P-loop ATPase [Clostridium tetanomorphum]|uniref:ATP-binding protein n=1 Tax=Clostridium tetanomorphum TaxID=1553 RepID=UPI0004524EDD|nr:ATP-binding protein [Clostridium tetanomorphum]KAJ51658.1 CobQ/CobB/MinD/ParA family protein [Clostridium tetanomorphum DSM 665]KAJ51938.1 CobQ/CobB/MinD/ParA family protein [Clostridium tetanomorphum DSM 665]MBP1864053.1 MinD superfamily P-loop ATPase [Clostridium tetanomorphum]NRS84466.1 MinD superfamily P-loop ATPase [Clostridium tetanomorphum]SQB92038.1 iron-sulfur binding protein [Clostridium tetanomorphum]